jgi:excisionase family DNA binding protein
MSEAAGSGRILLSVPEAAALLGISVRFTWTLISSGELRSVRIGGRRLVPRRELECFVDAKLAA